MTRAAGAALLGAAMALAALLFDTASLWVPSVALIALSAGAAVWVALAARGAGIERAPGPADDRGGAALPAAARAAPRACCRRPAGSCASRCWTRRSRSAGGPPGRCGSTCASRAAGSGCWSRGRSRSPTRCGLAVREISGGGEVVELLVLPRVEPRAGGRARVRRRRLGRGARRRRRAGRAARAHGRLGRRARPRRPAPLPRGHPRLAHPLARRGPQRRDAGAPAHRGRGLGAAGGARRHHAAVGRGARQGGARGGVAVRAPRPPIGLRAAAAG